jgi:GT2 family glycosyltransferase
VTGPISAKTTASPVADVVVPVHDASATLGRVLDAAIAAAGREHVIVVDDGSTDGSVALASERGVRVRRLERRSGPAAARNRGVEASAAEVVLFVDADCVLHPDALDRVRAAFAADPGLAALTGSYDDAPPEPGFASQYMNLRHHLTHQRARRDDSTFWAGCGAVRRAAFLAAGGFDSERYPTPQIEDIELGLRLRRSGARLRLDPALQVTHLKRWTLRSVLRTDLRQRALPWSELILERAELPADLNLRWSQRVAALLAAPALVSLPAIEQVAVAGRFWGVATAIAIVAASFAANRDLLAFFAARRGLGFATAAWLFHQLHLLVAAGALLATALRRPKSTRDLLRGRAGSTANGLRARS